MSDLTHLRKYLSQHPHIRHADPSSPDFSSLRTVYSINDAIQPWMIVRPQSADDVAGLLSVFTSHSIPFAVRTGGHDVFNRSVTNNSVTVDMRDIGHVSLDKASLTARVGGGVLIMDLVQQLAKEDVVTPTGQVGALGYVGWATHGGFGPMSQNYGLGVDQILGAKIVNAEGQIVDVDEKLLSGIRGGGGAFGIIVELTIKVYPLAHVRVAHVPSHNANFVTISDRRSHRSLVAWSSLNQKTSRRASSSSMTNTVSSPQEGSLNLWVSSK